MQEIQDVPTLLTIPIILSPCAALARFHFVPRDSGCGLLPVAGCNRGHSADVVATVNGHAIMRKDLDKVIRHSLVIRPQQQQLRRSRPIRCG